MEEREKKKVVLSSSDISEFYSQYNAKVKHMSKRFMSCPVEVLSVCSPRACILYMHILYRSNIAEYMTNRELAQLMGCTARNVENILSELLMKGCITVFYRSKSERLIWPNYILPFTLLSRSKKEEEIASIGNPDGWQEL